ncbi:MAG: alpha/beta hydrolase [Pseudomonadales bacterium]
MATLASIVCLTYAGLCALLYLLQDRLLFLPRTSDSRAVEQLQPWEVSVETQGLILTGWLIPAQDPSQAPLVFYYGGNAEDISVTSLDLGARTNANFLFMNYRGYGQSEGKPSQAALQADAVFIYDQMVARAPHNGKRVLFGRSLGSGVGIYLASQRQFDAAVLVTPYDSIRKVAQRHFSWLPVSLLLRHPFDSLSLAPKLDIPALFLLAEHDEIVPLAHSQALANSWGGNTQLVTIKQANHNSIGSEAEFWEPIRLLLQSL